MSWLPWYSLKVTFHLKSGEKLVVRCDDINIKHTGNELSEYNLAGAKKGEAFYLRINDISAITWKRGWFL